jgi:hypothetical protein
MSGFGEAAAIIGLISSVVSLISVAKDIYDAAEDASGLPKKFRVAAEQMWVVHHVLDLTEKNINAKRVENDALPKITQELERCRERAAQLKGIFEKHVPAKDDTKKDRVMKAAGIKLKGAKVKDLMEEMLKGIDLLAKYQVFEDASDLQYIKEAIDELANVTDDEQPTQSNTIHGEGTIYAASSGGMQTINNHSGPGNIIGTANYNYSSSGTHPT